MKGKQLRTHIMHHHHTPPHTRLPSDLLTKCVIDFLDDSCSHDETCGQSADVPHHMLKQLPSNNTRDEVNNSPTVHNSDLFRHCNGSLLRLHASRTQPLHHFSAFLTGSKAFFCDHLFLYSLCTTHVTVLLCHLRRRLGVRFCSHTCGSSSDQVCTQYACYNAPPCQKSPEPSVRTSLFLVQLRYQAKWRPVALFITPLVHRWHSVPWPVAHSLPPRSHRNALNVAVKQSTIYPVAALGRLLKPSPHWASSFFHMYTFLRKSQLVQSTASSPCHLC